LAKKAKNLKKGQKSPFRAILAIWGVFEPPGGSPGPPGQRSGRGFYINPRGVAGRAPRGPGGP